MGGSWGAGLQVFGEPDVAPPRQPARGPGPVQMLPTASSPLVLPAPLHQIHLWLSWPTVRVPQLVHGLWGALLPPGVRTCGHSWASSLETLIAPRVCPVQRGGRFGIPDLWIFNLETFNSVGDLSSSLINCGTATHSQSVLLNGHYDHWQVCLRTNLEHLLGSPKHLEELPTGL